jgi:hypothetical protein
MAAVGRAFPHGSGEFGRVRRTQYFAPPLHSALAPELHFSSAGARQQHVAGDSSIVAAERSGPSAASTFGRNGRVLEVTDDRFSQALRAASSPAACLSARLVRRSARAGVVFWLACLGGERGGILSVVLR